MKIYQVLLQVVTHSVYRLVYVKNNYLLFMTGGYNLDHPIIKIFWDIVDSFTEKQKRLLLKFVTSCSRTPLLGFKVSLNSFRALT